MPKFLVTYMGAEPGRTQPNFSGDEEKAFMQAWGDWAEKHNSALVEGGLPVGKTKRVDTTGVSDTKNAVTGFSIVEADSHADAAALFIDHPHVTHIGLSIEVMECLDMPEM